MARGGNVLRSNPNRAAVGFGVLLAGALALSGCTKDGKIQLPDIGGDAQNGPAIQPACTGLEVTNLHGRTFHFTAVGKDYAVLSEDSLNHTAFTFGDGVDGTAKGGLEIDYTYPKTGTYPATAAIISDVTPGSGLQDRGSGPNDPIATLQCPEVTVHVP